LLSAVVAFVLCLVSGLVLDERYDLHGNLMCKLFGLDFDFSGHFLFIGLEFYSSGSIDSYSHAFVRSCIAF